MKSVTKTDLSQSQNYVHNLFKHKINRYEYSALRKGLKFIPTPDKKDLKKVILNDFDEFTRKLRCKYYYDKGDNSRMHPFRKPSGYKPPLTCHALEQSIDKTKLELSSIQIRTIRNNTSILEREALTSLSNNSNIVIKKQTKATQ